MLTLSNLKVQKGAKQKKQRLGRGDASGRGNYSGHGMKGQKARAGVSGLKRLGMKKNIAQLPKHRGFNRQSTIFNIVNINILEKYFKSGEEVNVNSLLKLGFINDIKNPLKILSKGSLTKKLTVKAHHFSKTAKDAIIKAGGSVVETPRIKRNNPVRKVPIIKK